MASGMRAGGVGGIYCRGRELCATSRPVLYLAIIRGDSSGRRWDRGRDQQLYITLKKRLNVIQHQIPPFRAQGIPWIRTMKDLRARWDGRHQENKTL